MGSIEIKIYMALMILGMLMMFGACIYGWGIRQGRRYLMAETLRCHTCHGCGWQIVQAHTPPLERESCDSCGGSGLMTVEQLLKEKS